MHSETDLPNDGASVPGPDRAEVVVALAAIVLGLFLLVGSFAIDSGAGYDHVGPRFVSVPRCGRVGLVREFSGEGGFRRETSPVEELRFQTSLPALGTLSLALASSVLLLEHAGFVLTATPVVLARRSRFRESATAAGRGGRPVAFGLRLPRFYEGLGARLAWWSSRRSPLNGLAPPARGRLRRGPRADKSSLGFRGSCARKGVGVLPGIGPALTVALLLPVTYGLEPVGAFSCSPVSTTGRCTAGRRRPS